MNKKVDRSVIDSDWNRDKRAYIFFYRGEKPNFNGVPCIHVDEKVFSPIIFLEIKAVEAAIPHKTNHLSDFGRNWLVNSMTYET